jgi:hypothetical protein
MTTTYNQSALKNPFCPSDISPSFEGEKRTFIAILGFLALPSSRRRRRTDDKVVWGEVFQDQLINREKFFIKITPKNSPSLEGVDTEGGRGSLFVFTL